MSSVTEQKPEVNGSIMAGFNKQDDTHYQAASSDGETWYDMIINLTTGAISCKCPARVECRHIRNLRLLLAADGWQAFADKMNARAVAAGVVSAERVQAERQTAQAARRVVLSNGTSTFVGSVADGEGW